MIGDTGFVPIISAVIVGFCCVYALAKNAKSYLNQMWGMYCLLAALWCLGLFKPLVNIIGDLGLSFPWMILHWMMSLVLAVAYFHFVLIFLDEVKEKKPILILFYTVALLFSLSLGFLPKDIATIVLLPYYPAPFNIFSKLTFLFFVTFYLIIAFYIVYLLLLSYKSYRGYKRNQLKYILSATVLAFSFIVSYVLVYFNITVFPIMLYLYPAVAAIVTYSVAQSRIRDINVVFSKLIFVLVFIAIAVLFYFISVNILYRVGEDVVPPKAINFISTLLTIIFALILFFTPLRNSLARVVDDLVSHGKYAYQTMLEDASRALVTFLELDQLLNYIVETIFKNLSVPRLALFLSDDEKREYCATSSRGFDHRKIAEFTIPYDAEIVNWLNSHKEVFVKEEVERAMEEKEFVKLYFKLDQLSTQIVVPLFYKENLTGMLFLDHKGSGDIYTSSDLKILTSMANQASIAIENARLYTKAISDSLTRLYHQRYFMVRLLYEMHRARRYQQPLSLLMIDIDFFKKINDQYGHLFGDQFLKKISEIIKKSTRNVDLPARYGGEEFAVILPGTTLEGAKICAERLREKVAETRLMYGEQILGVTISVGIANYNPTKRKLDSEEAFIEEADKALYLAKSRGRNQVVVFEVKSKKDDQSDEEPPPPLGREPFDRGGRR